MRNYNLVVAFLIPLIYFAHTSPLPSGSADEATDASYDYIVVGSGPGGAPVAAQLAQSGYSVLLMDAGDDQRSNTNTSVAIVLADVAAEDEKLRWDFFVRYHADDAIEYSNRYATWLTEDGEYFVGQEGPEGAERLGIYYPRSGTLGGCSAHNAGAASLPQDSYWDYIAELVDDDSWGHEAMRDYFIQFEQNSYLQEGTPGHGFSGWLTTSIADPRQYYDGRFNWLQIIRQLAESLGYNRDETFARMDVDPNSDDPDRDTQVGMFGFPFHNTMLGNRTNANILLESTINNGHNLTIQLESLVTKVLFDESGAVPRAIGVEYMRGRSLYRADPRASRDDIREEPERRQIFAKNGIIISGGVFNTPQILKLSGVGPANELNALDIPVVVDLPGVGHRLQDDYEISIAAYASTNLSEMAAPGAPECTLGVGDDPCVQLWESGRGPYTTPGATHATMLRSSAAERNERDLVMWNPPDVFRGFFPGYSRPQGDPPTTFSFAMVHTQSRNHQPGGSITLRSSDPRDVPDIFFNFWNNGADADLQALYEGISFARGVLIDVDEPIGPFNEFQPCVGRIGTNCSEDATKDFIRRQVYSHHASSSAAIGANDDPMAVLDGQFRVRGVDSLYVSDGSALPRPPSPFPIVGQYMAAYKAAQAILDDAS